MRLLIVFTILIAHTASCNYTFHIFASKWPGTYCLLNDCWENQTHHLRENFFNIHGLWPSNNIQDDSPEYCDPRSKFLPDHYNNNSLINDLRSYWNPLDNTENDFHGHEWKKHGTCWQFNTTEKINITDIEKQKHYFLTVIDLSLNFNLFQILEEGGLKPSDWLQPLKKFEQTLSHKLEEGTFDLVCDKRKNKGQYLAGINICLDLNLKPTICPYHISNETRCDSEQIYYPAYRDIKMAKFLETNQSVDEIFGKFLSLIYWGLVVWMPMIVLIAIILKRKFFGKIETERGESQEVYLNLNLE